MADTTTPAAAGSTTAKAAAAEAPVQTLPQLAADARAAAIKSLTSILEDLPEPGPSGDFHLAGTRGTLQHCIDHLELFPANA